MTIYIEDESNITLNIDLKELCERTIEACIDYLKCPYETECNVLLTTNEEIHDINLEQREINRATDVLSFPMVSWSEIGDYDSLESQFECFHPESGELMLGDIIISIEKVVEQALEYGHTNEREFSFLITHSVLHLFGHDHMEEEERMIMERAQTDIMNLLGISR
ncbi:MAG: rRNA maturation RNase YbeY [Eubacteriales bacterium]